MNWQMQAVAEVGLLIGVVLGWRKITKNDALQDTRDGIDEWVWRDGAAKVGPLGKWSKSPVAKLQRELDALTKTYNGSK